MKSPSDHLLRTLAAIPVPSRVLDLGCGRGYQTEPLVRLGFDVYACDARRSAVQATRHRIAELKGDDQLAERIRQRALEDIDFSDASFDWVVAHEPTGYVSNARDVPPLLTAARRLLKPGGWVYLAIPDALDMPPEAVTEAAESADLAEAAAPEIATEQGDALVRAIFRRVEEGTPV